MDLWEYRWEENVWTGGKDLEKSILKDREERKRELTGTKENDCKDCLEGC